MRAVTHSAGKFFSITWLCAATTVICACGGGGGDDVPAPPPPPTTSPVAPVANLTVAAKQINFSWATVPTATSYKLLRNADGASGFTQVGADISGSTFNTSLEIAVHLTDWLNARYQIQACNALGCTSSNDLSAISGSQAATVYVKASNTGSSDFFGSKVVISRDGNTLAVSAPFEDSNAQGVGGDEANNLIESTGAVYVYARNSANVWAKQTYIKASNPGDGDRFGYALAISSDGNTLAVSAISEDSNAKNINGNETNDDADKAGAVYVYTRSGQTWSKQAYVKASNTDPIDFFGEAVALSGNGNLLAVSAIREDGAGGINGDQATNNFVDSGAVYVYRRTGSTWAPDAYLKAMVGAYTGNELGSALALSEDGVTLAVTAQRESVTDVNAGIFQSSPLSGAVYVYVNVGSGWIQQAYLKASNTRPNLLFGDDVALSADGNTLAVSAVADASTSTGVGGVQTGTGAPNSGAVYVYSRFGGVWGPPAYIKALNADAEDKFGTAIALNSAGDMLAVGAIGEQSHSTGVGGNHPNNTVPGAGAAYVFVRSGGTWTHRTYIKAKVTEANDNFGMRVALSGNGQTLAVSSLDASNATNVGGDPINNLAFSSGAVLLY